MAVDVQTAPYPRALKKFPVLRQSTLSLFDECGLASHFEMSYRKGFSTQPQGRGRLFHKFAGEAFRAMQEAKTNKIDVTTAIGILDQILTQEDADRECPHCGSANIAPGMSRKMERTCADCGSLFETEFVNVPMRMVADLYMVVKKWSHDNTFDIDRVVGVEERLNHTIRYSVEGVGVDRVLTGQPDVLILHPRSSKHMIVLDWKDTWMLPAASEISESGYFQQRFYAMLVMHRYRNIEGVTLREVYVRRSKVREATIWRQDLDQLDAEFAALAQRFDRAYEEKAHVPSAGHHCRFCPRPQACPIPVFTRGAGRITDERRARQVAAQLLVAKRVVKKSEDELKAYVDAHGPVEVRSSKGKRVYGFVEGVHTARPSPREIEDAQVRSGGTLSEEQIEKLYKTATKTRFVDHAPPREEIEEGSEDDRLLRSLADSIQRAAERKGLA